MFNRQLTEQLLLPRLTALLTYTCCSILFCIVANKRRGWWWRWRWWSIYITTISL